MTGLFPLSPPRPCLASSRFFSPLPFHGRTDRGFSFQTARCKCRNSPLVSLECRPRSSLLSLFFRLTTSFLGSKRNLAFFFFSAPHSSPPRKGGSRPRSSPGRSSSHILRNARASPSLFFHFAVGPSCTSARLEDDIFSSFFASGAPSAVDADLPTIATYPPSPSSILLLLLSQQRASILRLVDPSCNREVESSPPALFSEQQIFRPIP